MVECVDDVMFPIVLWFMTIMSDVKRLSRFNSLKLIFWNRLPGQGCSQTDQRVLPALIGELKGAPVHGHALTGTEVAVDLHRFGRIAVLRGHEPARFVCADGNQCEIRGTQATLNLGEIVRVVTCIPGIGDASF